MAGLGLHSADIAKDRHYNNPYRDFDANVPNDLIEKCDDSFKVSEAFTLRIRDKIDATIQNILHHEEDVADSGHSIYTGAAGVAMTLFFASRHFSEELNQAAKSLIKCVSKHQHRSRVNFLNGNSGILIMNAMINDSTKNKDLLNNGLHEMFKLVKSPNSDLPNELLYGRAGFLYSLLMVKRNGLSGGFNDSDIKEVITVIIDQGRHLAIKENYKAPLKFKWHDKNYYGGAHGTAGILYLLLQAKEFVSEGDLMNYIKPTINNLLECRFRSGNLQSSEGSTSDRLVQWCHGAPGVVQLFCLAFQIFKDQCYLDAAIQCGEVVWERGLLQKGCGLCHGTTGNAYTFITLYQLFKKQKEFSEIEAAKHLYRACTFAEWCFDCEKHQERCPDRPFSLYEGLAGTAYFLIDMLNPMEAAFPGYTVQAL